MTNHVPDTIAHFPAGATPSPHALSAGAMLRRAREESGLSIDAVAQQLKLAPRQVIALEQDDFARLPGRTFIRGFARNYARFLRIDPDAVLTALAVSDTSSLDSPALHSTGTTMGELPTGESGKPGWARWAIPLTLVAIIVTAAVYEFSRGGGDSPRGPSQSAPESTAPAPAPVPATPAAPPATTSTDTPLTNPVAAGQTVPPVGTQSAPNTSSPPPAASSVAPVAPAAVPAPLPATAAPAAAEVTVTFSYRGKSWTEVKERSGRVLLSQTMNAGQEATASGTPPFDLTIGNALAVTLSYRGRPVDLGPYTRANIARLSLE